MNFSAIPSNHVVGKFLRLPLQLLPRDLVLPVVQGPARGQKWIVGAGNHGYWLGSYEGEKVTAFAKAVRGKGVVYDIGANVGYYSMVASVALGSMGHVIAFEPDERNLGFLRRHLSLNHINNVDIVAAAVADCSGRAIFFQEPGRSMGKLSDDGRISVRTVTIDELIRDSRFLPPDVVKIDVEGAEMRVLRGAEKTLSERQPTIFLATHSTTLRRECGPFLRSLGYSLLPLGSRSLDTTDELVAVPERSFPGGAQT